MSATPRMRMFAGPNGSGKSTLKSVLPPELLGVYLNPDEIENEIDANGSLDLNSLGIITSSNQIQKFFESSALFRKVESHSVYPLFKDGRLTFDGMPESKYLAAAATDFLRHALLERRISFTFETVMSHRSKIELLLRAHEIGYRTYLYFIATDDFSINVSRVRSRVAQGGHSVPEDKIVSRYYRSLDLLMDAIRQTDRAYIFDNSDDGVESTWLAEITDGKVLEMKTDQVRAWFRRAVLDKI